MWPSRLSARTTGTVRLSPRPTSAVKTPAVPFSSTSSGLSSGKSLSENDIELQLSVHLVEISKDLNTIINFY